MLIFVDTYSVADVDPQIRAEQMGHTVDVNENVYTITSINWRKEAVNVLERALEA